MIRSLLVLFLLFIVPLSHASVPFNPVLVCEGPEGKAVVDGFYFSKYGRPIFAQQIVIHDENIVQFFESRGALDGFSRNEKYPREFVFSVYRDDLSDLGYVPRRLLGLNFSKNRALVAEISAPLMTLRIFEADPNSYQPIRLGVEVANWVFRSCVER